MTNITQTPKIQLTAQEFIDAWSGGYKGVKQEDGKGYWEDEFTGTHIVFDNIKITEDIYIIDCKILPDVVIKNSDLGDFHINKAILLGISIYNSLIKGYEVVNSSEVGYLRIEDNSIIGNIEIRQSEIEGVFDIINSTINKVDIENSEIQRLFIENQSNLKGGLSIHQHSKLNLLVLQGKELRKVQLRHSSFRKFNWKQDTFCNLNIEHCNIEHLFLCYGLLAKDSVFDLRNSKINQFKVHQFSNLGLINISHLEPFSKNDNSQIEESSTIQFVGSDLGKMNLISCNLKDYDTFHFYNTKMLEMFVADTQLPTKLTLPKELEDEKNAQERLAFSQFKKVAENRGDSVQATEFLALEMDAYAKQMENDNTKYGERFNLWLNKFSSNWGNDWVRAVGVTFTANTLFYTAYCHTLGYCMFGTDFCLFLDLASFSFEFLNPLRKADPLKDYDKSIEINWLARSIDYISRIFIAYFTYQTIQAFRRFGKKS